MTPTQSQPRDRSSTVGPRSVGAGPGAVLTADAIAGYWDAEAATFDDWLATAGAGPLGYSALEARAWGLLWRRVLGPPPRRVLDVGTGTGSVGLLLASLGYDVVGVDLSEAMLAAAAAKARRAGVSVTLEAAPADRLPFRDGAFDAVVAKLVLWTLLEPEAAVAEWRRCTRPGGRLAAVDISYGHLGPFDRARLAAARARDRRAGRDGVRGYMGDPERLAQLPLWRAPRDSFRNVFLRAGLERVLVEPLTGIGHLERRRLPRTRRLWPLLPRHLVEGVVPGARPTDDPSNRPGVSRTTDRTTDRSPQG